nr:MAG TPA: Cytosine specific methyltransferase [Caudoviricetes sp.]
MCFKYTLGSLFDGLGGWQIAAMRAGIQPRWSSEIEKFTCALTKVRFPDTEQLGDITKIDGGIIPPVDIVTMGSPCQDLSIAGKREGLHGERSGLFIRAVELIRAMRRASGGKKPRFIIWENVPGDTASGKDAEERTTAGAAASVGNASTLGNECILNDQGRQCMNVSFGKTGTLRAQERGHQPIILDLTHADEVVRTVTGDKTQSLNARMGTGGNQTPVIVDVRNMTEHETVGTLQAKDQGGYSLNYQNPIRCAGFVRRLTPLECERLQGLPDNWTLIDDKSCSDSARYKAIGNGMAQPCADFVMKRVYEFLQNS